MNEMLDLFQYSPVANAVTDADTMAQQLQKYNRLYRAGTPAISDTQYDLLVEQLRAIAPDHHVLHSVEPESIMGEGKIRHPTPMLSTEKAYKEDEVARFVQRIHSGASELGILPSEVQFRVTPKLDGLAGRDDGYTLATRGNGDEGYDITRAYDRGLVPVGGRAEAVGEIVCDQDYFDEYLVDTFEHPRSFTVGAISADTLSEDALHAYAHGAIRFVPYSTVAAWEGAGDVLVARLREIEVEVKSGVPYAMDGIVIEVTHPAIQEHLGHTSHHHRWQIAFKTKGESAQTTVECIVWQTARTGRITPVLEIVPTRVSGATISRVTAHHAGNVKAKGLGPGAVITIIRAGEVTPFHDQTITPSSVISLPDTCPSCGTPTVWEGDYLHCPNTSDCSAQTETTLIHFFKTLGNIDLMGPRTIGKLVENGYDTLEKIYDLSASDLTSIGFGPGQSVNIISELSRSNRETVDDWRFLAAFGVEDLGRGDSRRLLKHHSIETLDTLQEADLLAIRGFGPKTAPAIVSRIAKRWPTISYMMSLGFNLRRTPLESEVSNDGPLLGKNVVFTGSMTTGSREAMQEQARQLGANVQSSVGKTTHYLICGEKVGQSKMDKAAKNGTILLSEADYLAMIAN